MQDKVCDGGGTIEIKTSASRAAAELKILVRK